MSRSLHEASSAMEATAAMGSISAEVLHRNGWVAVEACSLPCEVGLNITAVLATVASEEDIGPAEAAVRELQRDVAPNRSKAKAAVAGISAEVLRRRGWVLLEAPGSCNIDLSAKAVLAFADSKDTACCEEALRELQLQGEAAPGDRKLPLICLLAHGADPAAAADIAALLCEAQRRLLAAGADDVLFVSGEESEAALEVAVALRVVRCRHAPLFPAPAFVRQGSNDSLALSDWSISDDADEDEDMLPMKSDISDASTACDDLSPCSPRFVECGVNTEPICSKPPKMPARRPAKMSDVCGDLEGRWVAHSVAGAGQSLAKVSPAFKSICIAGGQVFLADGKQAPVDARDGRRFLMGGELRIQDGKLIRHGNSGAVVVFVRETPSKGSVAVARRGRRHDPVRRRDMLRSLFRKLTAQ
eukprot:CAMPEP_0170230252 /NCGR_PEP_ID=MMETSP0116_2-20130129/14856_1 /TAXON_ID=400756 /ORGANISM="Durinskia baltica, Strain CSIRO CS-38" /LENGTH=415 /DNA_ID=CAMNT_0010481015 /DNA_START=1 /DNA_END=1248 /DNA_ORIENTATION=-